MGQQMVLNLAMKIFHTTSTFDSLQTIMTLLLCHGIISIITSTALNLVDIRITSTTLVHISTRTNRITRQTDLRPLIPLSAKLDKISTKSYCSRRTIRTIDNSSIVPQGQARLAKLSPNVLLFSPYCSPDEAYRSASDHMLPMDSEGYIRKVAEAQRTSAISDCC